MQHKLTNSLLLLFVFLAVHSGVSAQEPPDPVETDTLAPFVTTVGVSGVTSSTAVVNCEVTGNGGATVTERGVVYSTTNTVPTLGDSKQIIGNGNGVYSQTLTGLTGGTTYYLRAYATNIIGTSYGTAISFTTSAVPPSVTTDEISGITGTGATVGGNVNFSGGAAVTERGIVYATSNTMPTVSDTKVQMGSGNGAFSQSLTGLTVGAAYYVRAYAINSAGTSYGAVSSFTTDGPSASTRAVSTISTSSAVLGGEVTAMGSTAVTERGIVLMEGIGTPGLSDTKIIMGSGMGTFSQTVSSLNPATTYSVRAYATNGAATNYGGVQTFTTQTTLLSINTTGQITTNAIVVTYAVVFEHPVTGLTSDNFSVTHTGTIDNPYITAITGSGKNWNVTSYTGKGEGQLTLSFVNDNGISPGISNTVPFAGQSFTIDRTAPSLSMVSIRSNNADTVWAKTGDSIRITFQASEPIRTPVAGIAGHTATLTDFGGNLWQAGYLTQSTDTEGQVSFSISVTDLAGNAAATTTVSTNNTTVTYDKTIPAVSSINRTGSDYTNAASVSFTVTFSDVVTGVDAADFSLVTGGDITGASITSVSGSGAVYTVTVNTGSGNGTLQLNLNTSGTGIADRAGNMIMSGFTTGEVYTIAKILAPPVVVTHAPATVCTPVTVDLTDPAVTAGSDPHLTYHYYTDAAATVALANPSAITAGGTYYITGTNILNVSSAPVAVTVSILTLQKPTVAFTFDNYCINTPIHFTNASGVAGSGTVGYTWSDNNNHSSTAVSPVFTYTAAGSYTVKLKVFSQVCPAIADSLSKTVAIITPAPAIRMSTLDVHIDEPVQLRARNFGTAYAWSPAAGLSSSTIADPILRTGVQQQYLVAITEASGCVTTDTLLVRVFSKRVYVPSVFSPNGDGHNDKLFVNLVGVKQLRFFRIYNRYGKKLFETNNVTSGWDGTFNGTVLPIDTYVWSVEAIDNAGFPVIDQGTVTLLR